MEDLTGEPVNGGGLASDGKRDAIARDGVVNISSGLIGGACNFATVVVLTRSYGLADGGLFFQAVAVTSIVAGVCLFGAPVALMRFVAQHVALRRTGPPSVLGPALPPLLFSSAAAVTLVVLAHPVASALTSPMHTPALASALRALAPAVPAVVVTRLSTALARGLGHSMPGIALDTGGQPLLRLAVLLALSGASTPLWALGAAWSGSSALCAVGAAWWARHILLGRFGSTLAHRCNAELRGFWGFAAPRGVEEIVQVSGVWALLILVGALEGPTAAGVYAAVSRSALLGSLVLQGAIFAFGPAIAGFFATGQRERARSLYRTSTAWIVAASAPVFVVFLFFPAGFLQLFSSQAAAGASAFRVITAAMLVDVAAGPVGAVLLMAGRSTWNLMNAAVALTLALIVVAVTVPAYGVIGAALGWSTAVVVQNLLAVAQIWRYFGMHPFSRTLGFLAVLTGASLGGVCVVVHAAQGTRYAARFLRWSPAWSSTEPLCSS